MRYVLLLMILTAMPVMAQHDHAAQADGALPPQEVEDLLNGSGMGLARTAELNSYPGPKHVLELAEDLALTPAQRTTAEELMAGVQAEARTLGAEIVQVEQHLATLFAGGQATMDDVNRMTAHLAALRGRLRAVHLNAHIAMQAALTAEQIVTYDRLRGYTD